MLINLQQDVCFDHGYSLRSLQADITQNMYVKSWGSDFRTGGTYLTRVWCPAWPTLTKVVNITLLLKNSNASLPSLVILILLWFN